MSAPSLRARALDPERAHWIGRPLRDDDFQRLAARGVPRYRVNWSRGLFEPLLRQAVVFRRGNRFDFARHLRGEDVDPVGAYTVLARDSGGAPLDVVAWQPTTGVLACWLGRVGLLGEDFPSPATRDDPLLVFPDLPSWLAADRRGVVVVLERLARPTLLDAGTIQSATVEHGEALEAMLSKVRMPRIVVPVETVTRAAA